MSKVLVPRLPPHDASISEVDTYSFLQERDPCEVPWETIVERDQIERHLLEYNRASFRAASESPYLPQSICWTEKHHKPGIKMTKH